MTKVVKYTWKQALRRVAQAGLGADPIAKRRAAANDRLWDVSLSLRATRGASS